MKATIKLKGLTPVTFGRYHNLEKKPKESNDDYDDRTWTERAHYNEDGYLVIPANMVAESIKASSKYDPKKIPGKGNRTYAKHLIAGIYVENDIVTPYKREDVERYSRFLPAKGKGDTKRVLRHFVKINSWEGSVSVRIFDPIITKEVLEEVVVQAGSLVGIGTWRPTSGGPHGKFEVVGFKWSE